MKKHLLFKSLGAILFCILAAGSLFAQDNPVVNNLPRIIEEELVLKDPTVAQPKKWLVGGSGEGWYVWKNWVRWDDNGMMICSGKINGAMSGGTAYLGYDKLTLSYTYRTGSWDGSSDSSALTGATATMQQDQTEHEITARWLFKISKHFNPYVLGGYSHINRDDKMTVDAAHPFTYNGSLVSRSGLTYRSPLLGVGAIIPFNRHIGLRVDGRVMYSWAEWERDDGFSKKREDFSGAAVGTFYWNIWKGLNSQIGWKYQRLGLEEKDELGATSKTGVFVMLGYTFKF